MGEIYAAANGMVVFSYDHNGLDSLGGVRDDGATYGNVWKMAGGELSHSDRDILYTQFLLAKKTIYVLGLTKVNAVTLMEWVWISLITASLWRHH